MSYDLIFKPCDALTCVCIGGPASSSGCVRCFDSPEPQAGSPAQPGSRPSHCQLQQGCHDRYCGSVWRAPACRRLQPRGPLCGRAQSESEGCWKECVVLLMPCWHWMSGKPCLRTQASFSCAAQARSIFYVMSSCFLVIKINHREDKHQLKHRLLTLLTKQQHPGLVSVNVDYLETIMTFLRTFLLHISCVSR